VSHLPLGSRDPYHVVGVGAGFDFRWDGNVSIKVGYRNDENELIQLTSDSMVITIPKYVSVMINRSVQCQSSSQSQPAEY